MSNQAADAREGILDTITGKAKEVAGAVTGNDDLVEEGQLQQAEAQKRKGAVADDALAESPQDEAFGEIRETNREATEQESAARAQAAREESAVERERETQRAAASAEAVRQEAAGRAAAEEKAEQIAEARLDEADALAADARRTEEGAAAEESRLERGAAAAEREAAQLRAQTETQN